MSLNLLKTYNSQFYQLLDWPAIIRDLSRYAHFDSTKNIINRPPQAKSVAQISQEYDRVQYLIDRGEDSLFYLRQHIGKISSDEHFMQLIDLLLKSKVATISELHFVALCLESFAILSKEFKDWEYYSTHCLDPKTMQKLESHFIRPLRQFVDPNGTIDFTRHPELKPLYEKLSQLERDIRQQIQQIANSTTYSDVLQFKEHDVLNDRFVLAVRSDSYQSLLGPIVAKSSTGMTLYVEPPALKDKGNTRIQLLAQIEEITDRIARVLSSVLHQYAEQVVQIKDLLVGTDLYLARAHYIITKNLVRPLLSEEYCLDLENVFHPLIEKAVRNDFRLDVKDRGFIISGPNTGGKTVALKSMALCQLFLHTGLYLPISRGTIRPVDGLFFFSSDQQNLEAGLSSFASETLSYLNLFDHLEDENLIIVDEIFNSTSSDEASALAIAFLDEVHARAKAKVFISTHHQLFKTFIHADKSYISAHVGHDQHSFKPTYKIYTGEPGSSMAFHIFEGLAERLQVQTNIPNHAQSILDNKQISYDRLLQDLSTRKAELDRLINENVQINRDLKNQKKAAEGLAHLEKQSLIDHYRQKLDKKIEQANELIKQIRSQEVQSIKQVQRQTQQLSSELNLLDPKLNKSNESIHYLDQEILAENIVLGARYFSTLLQKELQVDSINQRKKMAQGICQKRLVQCPIASLRQLKNMPLNKRPSEPQLHITVQRTIKGQIQLDGRGMRLDEFMTQVETAIVELLNGDIPFLTIIHGHGTGALKHWLRNYLKGIEGIRFSPDDGNDGSTRVERTNPLV